MPRRGPGTALQAIAPLVEAMTPMEAGIALFLLLWAESGKTVPIDNLDACCAISKAVLAPHRATVALVVEKLFTPLSSVTHVTHSASRNSASVTHEDTRVTQVEIPDVTHGTNGHEYRNPQVSNQERQQRNRAKRIALRRLLTSAGVPADSRMGLQELENLCIHNGIAVPKILESSIEKLPCVTGLARAVSDIKGINALNSEFNNSNTSLPTLSRNSEEIPETNGRLAHAIAVDCRAAAVELRAAGYLEASEAQPELVALVAAGVTPGELQLAAFEAHARRKPLAYALAIARNRRLEAAQAIPAPAPSAHPASTLLGPPDASQAVPPPPEVLAFVRALKPHGSSH